MSRKISSIIIALVYMALGLLFIVRPQGVEGALCYVLAIALAVFGLLYMVGYFIASTSSDEGAESNGFAIGLLMIAMGVFIVVKQDLIITLVPFLFGVLVMIRGLFTLQTAFRIKRLGFPMRVPLIMGLVIMAFGLFIMLFPLESGEMLFILIGCGLLAAGVSGLIEEVSVRSMHRRREHERERIKDMGPAVRTYEAEEVEEVEVVEEAEEQSAEAETAQVETPKKPEAEATEETPTEPEAEQPEA